MPHLDAVAPNGKDLVSSSVRPRSPLEDSGAPLAGPLRGCPTIGVIEEVVNRVSRVSKAYIRRKKDSIDEAMARTEYVSGQKAFDS